VSYPCPMCGQQHDTTGCPHLFAPTRVSPFDLVSKEAHLAAENEALRKELEQARQRIARLESDLIRAEGELAKLEKGCAR